MNMFHFIACFCICVYFSLCAFQVWLHIWAAGFFSSHESVEPSAAAGAPTGAATGAARAGTLPADGGGCTGIDCSHSALMYMYVAAIFLVCAVLLFVLILFFVLTRLFDTS